MQSTDTYYEGLKKADSDPSHKMYIDRTIDDEHKRENGECSSDIMPKKSP